MHEVTRLLKDSLGRRGLTVKDLCLIARVSHVQFSNVLAGRRAGRHTWKHIWPHLFETEQSIVAAKFPLANPGGAGKS